MRLVLISAAAVLIFFLGCEKNNEGQDADTQYFVTQDGSAAIADSLDSVRDEFSATLARCSAAMGKPIKTQRRIHPVRASDPVRENGPPE